MTATIVAERWLTEVLSGDAQLMSGVPGGVHINYAKPNTPYPMIVCAFYYARDIGSINRTRIWTRTEYFVRLKTVGNSGATVETYVSRIDELLNRQSGSVTGGTVISCVRLTPIEFIEIEEGTPYRIDGGIYEICVQV